MSIYQPENIEELIENAKITLGHGMIEINVTPQQEVVAAQKAIQMFCDYHYDATERVFIAQEITPEDVSNNYISTPKNVWNVIRILGANKFPSIYGRNMGCLCSDQGGGYAVSMNEGIRSYDAAKGFVGASNALVSYYMAEANRSYFNSLIYPNIAMNWNRGSKRIRFLGDIRQATGCGKNFVVYEANIVNENLCFGCDNPEGEGSCFYDNEWLKEYTAARIQKIWGTNLSKFTNMNVMSGFDYNGSEILQNANEAITRLEEELFARYSLPAMMIIG